MELACVALPRRAHVLGPWSKPTEPPRPRVKTLQWVGEKRNSPLFNGGIVHGRVGQGEHRSLLSLPSCSATKLKVLFKYQVREITVIAVVAIVIQSS